MQKTPLFYFATIFPDHRLVVIGQELRYKCGTKDCARSYEIAALKIILGHGLPLTAHVETIEKEGRVEEICMVIMPVPEEYTFADEVQDDERYHEEKAEWLSL